MKLAAMLTLLLGVLGILNAVVEWVGGRTIQGTHEHALSLVLAVFASALLLAAGVAILRPTERGRQAGRLAVLASLVLIVAARVLHPWMSVFSQLVGIGLPVALLIALYWPRRASPPPWGRHEVRRPLRNRARARLRPRRSTRAATFKP